jgi:putative oxidoreductase
VDLMTKSRDLVLLGSRLVLGGYLAVHGAQKLFGSFGGPGLEPVAHHFDGIGLRPGKVTAAAAGLSEFGGGLLTMAGVASPLGPLAIAGTMAVASSTHRSNGPLSANGGYELALTNLAAALALAVAGPGRYSVDGVARRGLPHHLTRLVAVATVAASSAMVAMVVKAEDAPAHPVDGGSPEAD